MVLFFMGVLKMNEEIFRISKNLARAESLLSMAKERMKDIKEETKTYKIIEEYYEIIKELLTSLMYADGYKTLSHIKLIDYFAKNYDELKYPQIKLINNLRKLRNEILYYGKKIDKTFLINNEQEIKKIIKKLIKLTENNFKK